MRKRMLVACAAALMLGACGQGGAGGPPASPGEQAFAQCRACHSVTPGQNGVGPSLHGVVGRRAGVLAGFSYSDPLRSSGLTWDRATLDRYLAAPQDVVLGTRMVWQVADPAQRAAIIDYLETQR